MEYAPLGDNNGENQLISSDAGNDLELNSNQGADDPFHVFRDDVTRKLNLVDESLNRYTRVVYETDTAVNTHELKDSKKQLKRHLKHAESTLKDLQSTVRAVERNPNQFHHISHEELRSRQIFVEDAKDRLANCKDKITSASVRKKIADDEKALSLRRMGDASNVSRNQREESDMLQNERAQSQVMLKQQDETLDVLGEAVQRVGDIADNIHDELQVQNRMLSDFEEDLDDAEEKLGMVMGKLAKLLKTKNKW
eukprot:CAMPEP_0194376070 /NCGR_PEP_ID=MMETSP0174-20130528/24580_1 /TAXON_ID=216777 /ORGANISM="Proboscia alata, Strain PI-D3" /LENGTH=252 /DNA_ID=CAMNT_0039156617 /DNA_START=80 /DNA_END=835 /DNA_ORIENTATION=-